MPLIQVHHTPGKTEAQKRELVSELTEAYARVTGMDPAKVWVTITEVPEDSWGVGGTTLADRADRQV